MEEEKDDPRQEREGDGDQDAIGAWSTEERDALDQGGHWKRRMVLGEERREGFRGSTIKASWTGVLSWKCC